jgi:hypothetical protein
MVNHFIIVYCPDSKIFFRHSPMDKPLVDFWAMNTLKKCM